MSYKMNLSGDDSSFMSKIKSAGSSFNMTTIMYIIAAILFILIAVFIYFKWSNIFKIIKMFVRYFIRIIFCRYDNIFKTQQTCSSNSFKLFLSLFSFASMRFLFQATCINIISVILFMGQMCGVKASKSWQFMQEAKLRKIKT